MEKPQQDRDVARDRPRRREDRHGDEERPRRRERLPAMAAAEAGLQQVADLTGREPQGVTSLQPTEGGWVVGIEVVEDRRVPSSADVLALYEAKIDSRGDLTGYARKRRYVRGKSDGEPG
jgi:hypothetical protein